MNSELNEFVLTNPQLHDTTSRLSLDFPPLTEFAKPRPAWALLISLRDENYFDDAAILEKFHGLSQSRPTD